MTTLMYIFISIFRYTSLEKYYTNFGITKSHIFIRICSLKQVYNHQITTIQNYVNVYDYYRPVSGTAPCKLATVLNVRYCRLDCDEAA